MVMIHADQLIGLNSSGVLWSVSGIGTSRNR